MIEKTPIHPEPIENTIQAIARLHADHRQEAGTLQTLVEQLHPRISHP